MANPKTRSVRSFLVKSSVMLLTLWLSTPAVLGCATTPDTVHTAADYPETKVQASALTLALSDARRDSLYNDGLDHHGLPAGFEAKAQERLGWLVGRKGPALRVVTKVERAHSGEVESKKGPMIRIEVELKFEVHADDGTVIRKGKGASWAAVTQDKADNFEKIFAATALNAFDQYWASEDTIGKLNADIQTYTEYRARFGSKKKAE